MLYAFQLKQKPLQTSEKRLTAVVLAPPARLELTTFRLGGGPSIPVRYGGLYNKYSIFGLNRIRTNCRLGGERSIQLSYRDLSGWGRRGWGAAGNMEKPFWGKGPVTIKRVSLQRFAIRAPVVVRGKGFEPSRLPTRTSNVRVCQFRHPRISIRGALCRGRVRTA